MTTTLTTLEEVKTLSVEQIQQLEGIELSRAYWLCWGLRVAPPLAGKRAWYTREENILPVYEFELLERRDPLSGTNWAAVLEEGKQKGRFPMLYLIDFGQNRGIWCCRMPDEKEVYTDSYLWLSAGGDTPAVAVTRAYILACKSQHEAK